MHRHLRPVVVGATAIFLCATLGACSNQIGGGDDDDDEPSFPHDHPRIYLPQNKDRLAANLTAGTAAATRFKDIVDRQVLEGDDLYNFQGSFAGLIGQLTGDERYCTYAVELVDAMVSEEEALIAAGDNPAVARDSYLYVGENVGDAMLTYDWCFDQTTSSQRARWLAYARQAVWNVWNPDEAVWDGREASWSGWSIHNPSNNYYYSFLTATMMFGLAAHGEHPEAQGFLDFFRNEKIGAELVPTFESDLVGGGSREGTGYGVALQRLWEIYDFWEGSTGESLADLTPQARASLLAFMHQVMPTLDRIAPNGDHSRDSQAKFFDYHRNYIQELTFLFRDDPIAARAKYLLSHSTVPEMEQPFMYIYDFLYETPEMEEQALDGLGTAYYAAGIGQVYARSGWDTDATWVNLTAGPYTESHAHRDQGSFLIYKGEWLAYDPNIDSRSGIEQDEDLHNLVRITRDGSTVEMGYSEESRAVAINRGDGWLHVGADLAPVYGDDDGVTKIERELVYLEPDVIVIYDRVVTEDGATQTWQLNSPHNPTIDGARATFAGEAHTLNVERLLPADLTSSVKSWADGEFSGGFRLDATMTGGTNEFLHVMWIDGAVTSVTRSDADGQTGVALELSGGGSATVRFGAAAGTGSLELSSGGNNTSGSFSADIASLPEIE